MTTDPRALIAEAKRNLEVRPVCECANAAYRHDSCPACMADAWFDANLAENLAEILDEILDGYAAALDEVALLKGTVESGNEAFRVTRAEWGRQQAALRSSIGERDDSIARLTQLAAERYEEAEEVHALAGDAVQGARPTIAGLRQEVGEQALVIEQQGREVERVRVGLTAIRDNLINAGAAYHGASPGCVEAQLDIIERLLTIQGAPCTTK